MKNISKILLAIAVAAFLIPGATSTLAVGPVIDWGNDCYGVEPNYSGHYSTAGNELKIFGKIHTFYDPFMDLDPNTVEYTFVFEGMISDGTNDFGGAGIWMTGYTGGVFNIYADASPDFDFANQATFTDGIVILSGTLANFTTTVIDGFPPSGDAQFDFAFTGGSLYDRVTGCFGSGLGFWGDSLFPGISIPDGYDIHFDGKFNVDECPTAVEDGSWGEIKELFN